MFNFRIPFILSLLLLFASIALSQPFMKIHKLPGITDRLNDMLVVPDEGYAYLTEERLVWVDRQGQLLRHWHPDNDPELLFQKLIRTSTGKYCVLATKPSNKELVLHMVKPDATLERVVEFSFNDTIYSATMEAGIGGMFYITLVSSLPDKPDRITVYMIDDNGDGVWREDVPEGIQLNYALLGNPQGGLEITYLTPETSILMLTKFNQDGTFTTKGITGMTSDDASMPNQMVRKPDGGYLLTSYQFWGDRNADVNLINLDANGNLQSKHLVDNKMDDLPIGVHCDNDGVLLLTQSGKRFNQIDVEGNLDMVLCRLDLAGNILWRKGFGTTEKYEMATKLLVDGDQILVGGFIIDEGDEFPSTLLIGTGPDGNLMDHLFARPLQPSGSVKKMELRPMVPRLRTDEILHAVQTPDGGYLCAGRLIGTGEDDYLASFLKVDAQGREQWRRTPLGLFFSRADKVKPEKDGNFLAIVSAFDIGFRFKLVVKMTADGDVTWIKELDLFTSEDIVATPDGGCLVTGSVFGNDHPHTVLVKLDATGTELWRKHYGSNDVYSEGTMIAIDGDSKVIVAGLSGPSFRTNKGIYFLKTDLDGNKLSEKIVSQQDSVFIPQCLLVDAGNEVLIGGYATLNNSSSKNAILTRIDRSGNFVWTRHFDISQSDEITALLPMGQAGYYMAGTTNAPAFGSLKKIGFIATVKNDGTLVESYFLGDQQSELSFPALFKGNGNQVIFLGNKFEQYHTSFPVMGNIEPGIILSAGTPPNSDQSIQVYPNPARGATRLVMNNPFAGEVRISITGINGMHMKMMQVKKAAGIANIPLSLGGLPAGVYQVEIRYGKNRTTRQLVVLPN